MSNGIDMALNIIIVVIGTTITITAIIINMPWLITLGVVAIGFGGVSYRCASLDWKLYELEHLYKESAVEK